jgi:hypothetical protein
MTPNAGSKAFASNVTAGNTIVLGIRIGGAPAITVSDNLGNTYALIGMQSDPVTAASAYLYYAKSITGGACTVTTTGTRMEMVEISGLTATPLDQTAKANGTGTTVSSGATAARTQAAEIIIGVVSTNGGNTFTAGSGFTLREANADIAVQIEYQIVSATGTDAATMTLGSSAGWSSIVATFKASSAAGRLFCPSLLNGLGSGGPFFSNPLG